MIRPLATLALFALGLGAAVAQEAAPAPAAPVISVNPAATVNPAPKQANMLIGFYATQAVIDICALAIEPGIVAGMAADRQRLETSMGMDAAAAADAYARVKADVETTSPDCAEGSTDRASVDAVTAIYAQVAPAAAPAVPVPADAPAETPAQ